MATIGKNLTQIHRLQRLYFKPLLDPYHISPNSFALILNIGRHHGISQKQLCEITQMDEGLMTRMIKKLEENHILYKKRNTDDLRAYQLFLTDIGQEIYPQIELQLKQWWNYLLEDLPQEQLEEYIQIMTQRAKRLIKEEL